MGEALTVTVAGSQAGVRQALDAVEALSRKNLVPDGIRRRLMTALDEVLSNVVRHATGEGTTDIVLSVRSDDRRLEIEIADRGGPFDPLRSGTPDTSGTLEERRPGGLGIMLVRALADDLRYERRDGCNRLTMVWTLSVDAGESPHADQ